MRSGTCEAIDQFRIAAFGFARPARPGCHRVPRPAGPRADAADSRPDDADATISPVPGCRSAASRRIPPRDLAARELQAEFPGPASEARAGRHSARRPRRSRASSRPRSRRSPGSPPADTTEGARSRRPARPLARPSGRGPRAGRRERGTGRKRNAGPAKALAVSADNPDALALRARARVCAASSHRRGATCAVLRRELTKRPELYADVFVDLRRGGDWTRPRRSPPERAPSQTSRADVAKAQQKLAAERQRRAAAAAPTARPRSGARSRVGKRRRDAAGPPAPAADPAARSRRGSPRGEPAARPRRQSRRTPEKALAGRAEVPIRTTGTSAGAARSGVPVSFLPRRGVARCRWSTPFGDTRGPLDVLRCGRPVRNRQGRTRRADI